MRWRIALALAFTLAACAGCAGDRSIDGAMLAVVSYSPDEVVLLDPETLSVADRVPLRSMGTSPVALPGRRAFVTAQCGGVGTDSDDALAVIDLRSEGRVEYVDLPTPNPCGLCVLPDGRLAVVHGVWDGHGLATTIVDLEGGDIAGGGTLSNVAGSPVAAGGWLWSIGPEGADETSMSTTVRRTTYDLGTSAVIAECDGEALLMLSDGNDADTVLRVESRGGSAIVERRATRDFALAAQATVPGVREAISSGIVIGEFIVLSDGTGADVSDPGGPLLVLDRVSLSEVRRIDVGGCVSSMAAIGDTLYAVSWRTGEVTAVDPASGEVLRRAAIPGCEGKTLQMAAME